MFRLIKLAMYALVGYAIYELYQGMSTGSGYSGGGYGGGGGRDLDRAMGSSHGRMQTLTGGGEGQAESTLDDTGTSATHRVGRGVTST
jgi:hypothetical protein